MFRDRTEPTLFRAGTVPKKVLTSVAQINKIQKNTVKAPSQISQKYKIIIIKYSLPRNTPNLKHTTL